MDLKIDMSMCRAILLLHGQPNSANCSGSPKSRRSPLGGSAPEQERSYRTKNRDRMRGKGVQSSRKEKEKKEAEIEIDIAQTEEKQSKKEVDTGDKRVDGNIRIDDEKKRKEETSAKKKEESEKERKKEEHDQRSENNEQEKQRRERTAKDKKDKAENGEKAPRKAKGDEKASAKKMSDDSKEKGSSSLTEFISEHSSNSKSERSEEDDLSHNGKKQPEHGDQVIDFFSLYSLFSLLHEDITTYFNFNACP